jgi:hypothetical protein
MSKAPQPRWLTWPVTALLVAGCAFPPPPPAAPPLPTQAHSAALVLMPTNTPPSASASPADSALTPAQQELLAGLPALGAAPELQNDVWFNSEPLQLSALRGKVVMVEFWTYG